MKKIYALFILICILSAASVSPAHAFLFRRKTDSLKIVFNRDQLILPGESFEIGVVSYYKNGKTRKTIGMDGGFVFWWRYEVEVTGGSFNSGKITVNPKLMPTRGKYISVKVFPKKHPDQKEEILIPLNYEIALEFFPEPDFLRIPGSKIEGTLTATFNNGMARTYKNPGHYKKAFAIETSGGKWDNERFIIEPDFKKIPDHRAEVEFRSLRNPAVSENFHVTLDYKYNYELFFSSRNGDSGNHGANGKRGTFGDHGNHGETGENGEPGRDGPDIGIWADLYYDSILKCYLLYVYTENMETNEFDRYLVNPDGGTFSVTTVGGDGGDGGNGGHGGKGAAGIAGDIWYEKKIVRTTVREARTKMITKIIKKRVRNSEGEIVVEEKEIQEPKTYYVDVMKDDIRYIRRRRQGQNGGDGGDGGDGGLGGKGGNGGDIFFYFTEDAKIFENVFTGVGKGGSGGKHGRSGTGANGGPGGVGEPSGRHGHGGRDGAEVSGWAFNGRRGKIKKGSTDEFFFYIPEEDKSVNAMGSAF